MNINIDDIEAIRQLLEALAGETIRKVEATTAANKIMAYWLGDNQVRVDIISKKDGRL